MKNLGVKLMAATILMTTTGAVLAEGVRGYLGAGGGSTSATITTAGSSTGADYTSSALRLLGGIEFNKNFAVEAEYVNLGAFKDINPAVSSVANSGFGVAAKATMPFPNKFSIFGKLGVASIATKYAVNAGWIITVPDTQSKTGLSIGLGGAHDFTDNFSARVSMDTYDMGESGLTGRVRTIGIAGIAKF